MKSYFIRLLNRNGQIFDAEYSSTNVRTALDAAMQGAEKALELTPFVQVLDSKGEMVWQSWNGFAKPAERVSYTRLVCKNSFLD